MIKKSPFARVDQIGVVVRDLDKAIKHYESLGFGPFQYSKVTFLSRELWGKPVPPEAILIKVARAQAGQIEIELVQPVAEETHWMEFLKTRGEGINHLGFYVDDIDKEEAKLVKKGLKIVYRGRIKRPDGSLGGAAYFDTGAVGGVLFEPIQRPPK